MLTHLKIERFKSIRYLELQCRRVNLFIGEPNTGKSNILEALGMLSWCAQGGELSSFVRPTFTHYLFYDGLTEESIWIQCQGKPAADFVVKLENDRFPVFLNNQQIGQLSYDMVLNVWTDLSHSQLSAIRKYRFRPWDKHTSGPTAYSSGPGGYTSEPGALIPPDGPNLFAVVYGSRALRQWMTELFRPYGLSVVLKPHQQAFELQKLQDGVAISYPFASCSETLQRIVFYYVAMASNRDAVLVFEEPEAHAFPYYTKYLGEQIAADSSNQYFIATHNPYLLEAVLEKAHKDEVAVFATQYKNYETKARALTTEQIGRLLDADPFLGLQTVLELD